MLVVGPRDPTACRHVDHWPSALFGCDEVDRLRGPLIHYVADRGIRTVSSEVDQLRKERWPQSRNLCFNEFSIKLTAMSGPVERELDQRNPFLANGPRASAMVHPHRAPRHYRQEKLLRSDVLFCEAV